MAPSNDPLRVLITAGPTQEPIDAVRYLGNTSSGKLGSALADAVVTRGWNATLLLGPHAVEPESGAVTIRRFRTTADLEAELKASLPDCDILIMAAAVADYRPIVEPGMTNSKLRRGGDRLTLEFEPTPDLLAGCAARRRPDQTLVGFALEPKATLLDSARRKLNRKAIDLVVANPLETMNAGSIAATVLGAEWTGYQDGLSTPGTITKDDFAIWLLDLIAPLARTRLAGAASETPRARA